MSLKKIVKITPIEDFVGVVHSDGYGRTKKGDQYNVVGNKDVLTYEIVEETPDILKPGVYVVRKVSYNLSLKPKELLVEPNVPGVDVVDMTDKIKTFFDSASFFTERGLIPKRGVLLTGYQGCGKTHSINRTIKELVGQNGVAMYLSMDEIPISGFVDMLENYILDPAIDKLFIIIEDLGGGEITDKSKGFFIPSMSNLLALLDGNSLPWKKMPTVILSTTNYPKNFLANLIDRPGRFDEVIEVKMPSGQSALAYAKSLNIPLTDFDCHAIEKGEIGLAHVKEACILKAVYKEHIPKTIESMRAYSKQIQKDLEEKLRIF